MKSVKAVVANPVRVQLNTVNKDRHQWATIIDAATGKRIHTGQPKYIKRVAKKKFNLDLRW
jgi:hypothetical protein